MDANKVKVNGGAHPSIDDNSVFIAPNTVFTGGIYYLKARFLSVISLIKLNFCANKITVLPELGSVYQETIESGQGEYQITEATILSWFDFS